MGQIFVNGIDLARRRIWFRRAGILVGADDPACDPASDWAAEIGKSQGGRPDLAECDMLAPYEFLHFWSQLQTRCLIVGQVLNLHTEVAGRGM